MFNRSALIVFNLIHQEELYSLRVTPLILLTRNAKGELVFWTYANSHQSKMALCIKLNKPDIKYTKRVPKI